MAFPDPVPGLVIRYAYLWRDDDERGLEEGAKDRPCAVLLAVMDKAGRKRIIVLPITHTPPRDPAHAVEIPAATKRRLGLDAEPSWIVFAEANRFTWPGPDLRPMVSGNRTTIAYGQLPADFFRTVRDRFLALAATRRSIVNRSE